MNLKEFIKKYDGVGVDYDGRYGDQCMDLFHRYEIDVLGISEDNLLRAWSAYTAFLTKVDHFDVILYKPGMTPKPGDVMFWNTGAGKYGHVAIFIEGDDKSFVSLDQNWPVGSITHEQKHDYNHVAGWLRYNKLNKNQMEEFNSYKEKIDNYISQTDRRLDEIENVKGKTEIVKIIKKLKPKNWGKKRTRKISEIFGLNK